MENDNCFMRLDTYIQQEGFKISIQSEGTEFANIKLKAILI